MRVGSIVMLLVAVVFAVAAGLLTQNWLERQSRQSQQVMPPDERRVGRIVVAAQPLRFGTELNAANIREIEWPLSAMPVGAFASKADLLKPGERRVVLSAVETSEAILKWKVTGPGQRASLSSIIDPSMKAVTIRVNDVFGVAGFVLPGDRVDVMLTRNDAGSGEKKAFTEILMQHVRVLGIDQLADDRSEKPSVVKAVTLEVPTTQAQKLVLAGTVGSLSLALRPAGSTVEARASRITTDDLTQDVQATGRDAVPPSEPDRTGKVGVTRALSRSEYSVPSESRTQ